MDYLLMICLSVGPGKFRCAFIRQCPSVSNNYVLADK